MTPAEKDFLERLEFKHRRLPSADRVQDRMRQKLRKAGLIECVMNPRRWIITDAGRKALAGEMK